MGPLGARSPCWLSDLKLYSVYSPPEHADSAVRRTKADAAEERHQRPPRVAAKQASLPAHIRQYSRAYQGNLQVDQLRIQAQNGVASATKRVSPS